MDLDASWKGNVLIVKGMIKEFSQYRFFKRLFLQHKKENKQNAFDINNGSLRYFDDNEDDNDNDNDNDDNKAKQANACKTSGEPFS